MIAYFDDRDVLMEHECVRSQDKLLFKLKGEFTIQWLAGIRAEVMEALENADAVELSLGEVTETDVTALQLLCSMHRASVNGRKQLTIVNGLPPSIMRNALDAGFIRRTGCPADVGNTCLWIMEKS